LQAIKGNRVLIWDETRTHPPSRPIRLPLRTSPMLEINADPLAPAVIQLFSKSESTNINRLVLISFRLARARAR
jgi:hypothetical protein